MVSKYVNGFSAILMILMGAVFATRLDGGGVRAIGIGFIMLVSVACASFYMIKVLEET